MRHRPPLDLTGGRPATAHDLQLASGIIDLSGVVDVLAPLLDAELGRRRTITVRGALVACQVNALARHHQGHLVEVARVVNAMTDDQRRELGFTKHDPAQTYDRLDRLFLKLATVLEAGQDGVTATWMANAIANAAVPTEYRTSASVAVDGTDVETWGALHGDVASVALDGDATDTQLIEPAKRTKGPQRKAKIFGRGADGRNIYTIDRDARAGHRSATNSGPAGPYIGYELHLAVQTRDVRWTNYVDQTSLSDEVPGVVTTFALEPAGTHRGNAIVDDVIATKAAGAALADVVWDPGYSLCTPDTTQHKLAAAGIRTTFQVVTHQRNPRPFSHDAALLIDGQLFSSLLPDDLRDLPVPPRGSSDAEKLTYEAKFNQRARWRLVRHSGPDADGATRWRCPFCAGMLRARAFPKTLRRPASVPLVAVDAAEACCGGTLTAMAVELPLWQAIPFGTTAWRISMGRRQVVESANAALKGAFADLSRGFVRVFGQTKMTVLLGFTIAGYNLDRIRSFRSKQRALADKPVARPKRRSGTWQDLGIAVPADTAPTPDSG